MVRERGGLPREQRWFIKFGDEESVDKYAEQLDFFGIELGALFPDRGELIYLSKMSTAPSHENCPDG